MINRFKSVAEHVDTQHKNLENRDKQRLCCEIRGPAHNSSAKRVWFGVPNVYVYLIITTSRTWMQNIVYNK